jgi:hypothetical protein
MTEYSIDKNPSILSELKKIALPDGSYMVMGSGILDALDIRRAHDIDLVVNQYAFDQLLATGWDKKITSGGQHGIKHGVFEAYSDWTDDDGTVKTVNELLVDAQWVNGVPFNSLAKLSLYKTRRGQEKDLNDLVLIQQFIDATLLISKTKEPTTISECTKILQKSSLLFAAD